MSSDFIEHLVGLLDGRVDLSSHVALDNYRMTSVLLIPSGCDDAYMPGYEIVTQPDHNDAI